MRTLQIPALILCLFATSCATKVGARHMAPARFDVGGIRRLAVAGFRSSEWGSERWAGRIRDGVESSLSSGGFFELVDGAPEVRADAEAGGDGDGEWRRWGRIHGADGVLAGTVSVTTSERRDTKRHTEKVKTGRHRNEYYTEGGVKKVRRVEIVEERVEFIPILERNAQIDVAVALLDVKTGGRVAYERYTEDRSREAEGEDDIRRMDDGGEMLGELAAQIVPRISNDLQPHEVVERLKLSSKSGCEEGVKLARDGDWDAARDFWRALIASDPDNDAAYYNLGVAAEVAGDFEEADERYLNALEIRGRGLYRKALDRVGDKIEAAERLKGQLLGRDE